MKKRNQFLRELTLCIQQSFPGQLYYLLSRGLLYQRAVISTHYTLCMLCYTRHSTRCYIFTDAFLKLYGSSCNGFGSDGSDMDICMVLEQTPTLSVSIACDPSGKQFTDGAYVSQTPAVTHCVTL